MPASKSAPKKADKPQASPAQQLPQPSYPTIEKFVERAQKGDVDALFQPIEDGLKSLKGPRAQQGKKVEAAIERTRELLSHLVEVREKLESEKKAGGKAAR